MKTPSERGVIGAWAYQARQEAGLSVEQVAEAIGARGTAVSPATIRGIESGAKKPGAMLLRMLGTALGSTPPGVTASAVGDDLALRAVLAAERQADALEEANAIARAQLDLMRLLVPGDRIAELAAAGVAWAAPLLAHTPQRHPDPTDPQPAR